jgi:hypothetical protein
VSGLLRRMLWCTGSAHASQHILVCIRTSNACFFVRVGPLALDNLLVWVTKWPVESMRFPSIPPPLPRAVLNRVLELKDYTAICSSGPSEVLALIALRR